MLHIHVRKGNNIGMNSKFLHKNCIFSLHLQDHIQSTVLQISRGNRDNFGIIIYYLYFFIKIFCDPSLEPSRRHGSNAGSQHMFLLRNKKKKCLSIAIAVRKIIFELSLIPLLSGALSLHIYVCF